MEKLSEVLLQILNGGTLKDKLSGSQLSFGEIDWSRTDPVRILSDMPGREGVLKPLNEDSHSERKVRFPKKSELKNLSSRGLLLHFFANHELLAIETMAYTLLKFPNAPLEFQKGVMKTLQDEQRHLGMYLERMREYGVDFGQVPLNLYFWNTLKTMESPLDFVTRMSLTFEQANLDFALEYAEMFEREIADEKTATLLRKVHDDEVAHVAHGLKWFKEWKPKGESEWESYQSLLSFPLTPRRAKGAHFFAAESRVKAGLSSDYIEHLKVAGGSRGRVPDFFFYNPQCEIEGNFSELSFPLKEKIRDLAPLILWLSQEDDVVELPAQPPLEWLSELHRWKGELSEMVLEGELPSTLQKYVALEEVKPWGWGRGAWKRFNSVRSKVRKPPLFSDSAHSEKFFHKGWWKSQLGESDLVLNADENEADVKQRGEAWWPSHGEVLLKTSMSTSGRGHLLLSSHELQDRGCVKILERLKKDREIVLERFLEKKCDFSVQYEIQANGIKSWEPRIFLNDSLFQFRGVILGSPGQLEEWHERWTAIHRQRAEFESAHSGVLEVLRNENYRGPVGIDCMIHSTDFKMKAVVEVNARYTMGRVAHEIERVLKPKMGKEAAIWLMVQKKQLKKLGFESFEEWKSALAKKYGAEKVISTSPLLKNSTEEVETWTVAVLGNSACTDLA